MQTAEKSPDRLASKCLSLLEDLLGDLHPREFAVRLWDGSLLPPESGHDARFTLVIRSPGALRALLLTPTELALGEAFVYGGLDVEGDLGSAFSLAEFLVRRRGGAGRRLRLVPKFLALPADERPARPARPKIAGHVHSLSRDRQAVTYHYDLSRDFYSLWLDKRMVYSCACFSSPDEDLETGQERKLDIICRKLRLRQGERLLDIGCGWGGLLMHAVRHYGVEGVGITLSRPQAEFAGERIREEGLSGRCRIEVRDYREMEGTALFDKISSIGMFEHVGASRLPEYFRRAFRLLRPGGAFLNHGIARNPSYPDPGGPSFSDYYVFPDGDLLPLSMTLRTAEEAGFEVRDVESLREHYVLTLNHWARRLEAHADMARRIVGEKTYRIWRIYLHGAAHTFAVGKNNVYQALLLRPDEGRSGLPLSREDWYR